MTGVYDPPQATLSVLIAIAASYAALDLAGPVTAASGCKRLIGGRTAMGIGIWATHYIGMSGLPLTYLVQYDWPAILVSQGGRYGSSLKEPESPLPEVCDEPLHRLRQSLYAVGGKCSNIFSTDLLRSFMALSGLSGSVSVADPRQISLLLDFRDH